MIKRNTDGISSHISHWDKQLGNRLIYEPTVLLKLIVKISVWTIFSSISHYQIIPLNKTKPVHEFLKSLLVAYSNSSNHKVTKSVPLFCASVPWDITWYLGIFSYVDITWYLGIFIYYLVYWVFLYVTLNLSDFIVEKKACCAVFM